MSIRGCLGSLVWCVFGALAFASTATADEPAKTCGGGLRAQRALELVIDGATGAGQGTLVLENTGDKAVCSGLLSGGDFVGKDPSRPLGASLTFAAAGSGKRTATLPLDVEPNQRVVVEIFAQGIGDLGEARAPLFLDGKPLETVVARKPRVPFDVRLPKPGTEEAPVQVALGEPLRLRLQNADGLDYRYRYRFYIGEEDAASGQGLQIGAAAVAPLVVEVPRKFFPNRVAGLFRAEKRTGTLTLELVDPDLRTTALPRSHPVVLSLARWRPDTLAMVSTFAAFLVLTLGGLTSLYLTHGIPNAFRRMALKKRLLPLAVRTRGLSQDIAPPLRVGLGVQRVDLAERISRPIAFFPGTTVVLEEAAADTAMLARRVELIGRIDDRHRLIHRMGSEGPPDLLHDQKMRLTHLTRLIAPSHPDETALKKVESALFEIDEQLAKIEANDEALRTALVTEATAFYEKSFLPAWSRLPENEPWADLLRQRMGGFLQHVKHCFALGGHQDETLASLDTALTKLRLIGDYMRICESATPTQEAHFDEQGLDKDGAPGGTRVLTQRERFFECVSGAGARTLDQARLVLLEAQQGIFAAHLVEQVQLGRFSLRAEPASVVPYEIVSFHFVFNEDRFNDAAARDKLTCTWSFENAGITRSEACWSACHFFTQPGLRMVTVNVHRGHQRYVPNLGSAAREEQHHPLLTASVHVRKAVSEGLTHATKLEVVQLAVALVLTMGALVAGAREQLDKLDIGTAIAAVFALGFGADIVKNLVAHRPPAKPNP
jgi:hypothetical protein